MIKSEENLKNIFHISDQDINYLIGLKSKYRRWLLPKKSGGYRTIVSPHPDLKKFQKKISEKLTPLINTTIARGGIKKQDRNKAVEYIFKCNKILKLDIKNCFPSIKKSIVYKKLIALGFSHKYASSFSEIITLDNCLPQGSPCSTCIANLVLNEIDIEIIKILPNNAKSFRWVDDIIIALDKNTREQQIISLENNLINIFSNNRFEIKNGIEVFNKEHANDILGISISKKVNVSKKWYKNFRAQLNNASYRKNSSSDINALKGKLSTLNQITKKHKKKKRNKKIQNIIKEISQKVE